MNTNPTADDLIAVLADEIGPQLTAILARARAAEAAYGSLSGKRNAFDDREAEEGFASLRFYVEGAQEQVQRIVRARR